jgi:tape measure domain-containing protein
MAERELPPIRVRIVGITDEFDKALDTISAKLADLQKKIKTATSTAVDTSARAEENAKAAQRRADEKHKIRMQGLEQQNALANKALVSKARKEMDAIDKRSQAEYQRVQNKIANDDKLAKLEQRRLNTAINDDSRKANAEIRRIQGKADLDRLRAQNTIKNQNALSAQRVINLQNKGTADLQRIYNKINNDNQLFAQKQLQEAAKLGKIKQQMNNAAATHAQRMLIMDQQLIASYSRASNVQAAGQQKAAKHAQDLLKMQQQLVDMQRKANQDASMHLLKERKLRWEMARDEEAHRQKLRIEDEIHQKRMRSRFYTTQPPAPQRAARTAAPSPMFAGVGGGLGGGLTARADIYMHANAMRALISSGQGLLDMYGNLQLAESGIRAFTGSAQAASVVMADIKDHAEKTSFTRLGLAEATRNMMSYGLSAKNALEHMKMLGDVAGGSELRFERLSFAMSQITANGRLQGNELRQLTEQGFNPLETMSRVTGRSMLELRKMMEDGAISADHVTEALKIETSAGGRFANMQKQMANTLPGVRNQLKETAQNLKMGFISAIEKDLVYAMKTVIGYLKLFEQYLQTPAGKAMAIRMVEIAKNVFIAAVAFHAIGFAMASLMWWSQSVFSMLNRIVFVFRALATGISLLVSIVTSPFALIVAGAIAAGLAVAYVASQIWGPNSVYDAFLNLYNTVLWFFSSTTGFLYNFGHNWSVISKWLLDNWATIIPDMMDLTMRFFGAMINNAQVGFRTVARLMVVFTTWLVDTWYSLFDGRVYEAMVSGFIKIFTWLEDKWKAFANFMSKVWENLFDPGALYDILSEGMGIDATANAMTQDIQTTLDKGLFEGIKGVIESEYGNLSTGLEGFQASTPELTGLKFDVPTMPPPPKAPELPDAGKYTGPGFAGLGAGGDKAFKATEAMSATGADYNKLLAEQSARMATSKAHPQLAAQQQTNTLLGLIYNALKGAPQVNLQPAGVAGQGAVP